MAGNFGEPFAVQALTFGQRRITRLGWPRMPATGRSSNLGFQPVQVRNTIHVSFGSIRGIPAYEFLTLTLE